MARYNGSLGFPLLSNAWRCILLTILQLLPSQLPAVTFALTAKISGYRAPASPHIPV